MNALILVDLQNDFLPGGALPVPHGDEVIPLANELQQRFDLVVATKDWHPPDHGSFAANHKGTERNVDSYSTFFDNAHRRHTGLAHYLEKHGIKNIYLMGLALDYCVKYSALDTRQLGLNTHVILDGCRGIELEPGDISRALDEMKRAGVTILKSGDL